MMKKLINILLSAALLTSCVTQKRCAELFPPKVEIKDSVSVTKTATKKDSVINIPASSATAKTTIDSLLKVIGELQTADTGKSHAIAADSTKKVVTEVTNGKTTATLSVDKKGNLYVDCKTDSLQQRISWLEWELSIQKFTSKKETVQVPVEVPKPFIPGFVWWSLAINAVLAYLVFKNPIKSLIQHHQK